VGIRHFREAVKTLCSADSNGRDSHRAQCFDIDSGKKIAEFTGFKAETRGGCYYTCLAHRAQSIST